MSEIKPCMNTECVKNDGYSTSQCYEYFPVGLKDCPLYRSEPKPEPWKPLNPDEYEQGCINEECVFFNSLHNCNCSKIQVDSAIYRTKHQVMCECVNCYRPKKKPETVKRAVIKFDINQQNHSIDAMIETLKKLGFLPVSGEIIKEEIKK